MARKGGGRDNPQRSGDQTASINAQRARAAADQERAQQAERQRQQREADARLRQEGR